MASADQGPVGLTGREIAERVRIGELKPTEVVRAHLEHIASLDHRIGAFQLVRAEKALAEAEEVGARPDLGSLTLAGVPVAIKDNVAVAGEPIRHGSAATSDAPCEEDHLLVRRLRDAGAVIVGVTRMPEFGLWGATDNAFGLTRNPWNLARTPGGSSGGAAAAVSSGMVPIAHANDGLGSIRIPSAACGVFGLKPSAGVLPLEAGDNTWFGLAVNGAIATTVGDVGLALAVMADRPGLGEVEPPGRELRVALSTKSPLVTASVDPRLSAAVAATGRLLAEAGHAVVRADPPYSTKAATAILVRWFQGLIRDADEIDLRRLEPRTRKHAAFGLLLRRFVEVREEHRERWQRAVGRFFEEFDVLITPATATTPIAARDWRRRGWLANVWANTRFAPFSASWNFAGYPAAAVPAGPHPNGLPLGVQVVASAGEEALVLSVARQLEVLRPWPRHAPIAGL